MFSLDEFVEVDGYVGTVRAHLHNVFTDSHRLVSGVLQDVVDRHGWDTSSEEIPYRTLVAILDSKVVSLSDDSGTMFHIIVDEIEELLGTTRDESVLLADQLYARINVDTEIFSFDEIRTIVRNEFGEPCDDEDCVVLGDCIHA